MDDAGPLRKGSGSASRRCCVSRKATVCGRSLEASLAARWRGKRLGARVRVRPLNDGAARPSRIFRSTACGRQSIEG
jgi:hypothetical protein